MALRPYDGWLNGGTAYLYDAGKLAAGTGYVASKVASKVESEVASNVALTVSGINASMAEKILFYELVVMIGCHTNETR